MILSKKLFKRILGKESWEKVQKVAFFKKNCFLDVEASICKKNFCYALSQLLNPYTREIFACFNDATNFF